MEENKEESVDYTEEDEHQDQPPVSSKKRGASRLYFVVVSVMFAVLLLISVISLGSFAAKHAEISDSTSGGRHSCVLFGRNSPLELGLNGYCAFVLWGQVTLIVVFLVWLIYSIVLTIVGPKVVSVLRVLDLVMSVLSGLLSFGVSVTLHAGLNQTCAALSKDSGCKSARVPDTRIGFYGEVSAAKSTSWIISIMFILLSLWYGILLAIFCIRCGQRKKFQQDYGFFGQEEFEDDDDEGIVDRNSTAS